MKLISFQIKNYKVIDDTKPVKADPRVIALVGKNESGKSSILRSLWKSRNVAGAKFDKLYDYPRDTYSRDVAPEFDPGAASGGFFHRART